MDLQGITDKLSATEHKMDMVEELQVNVERAIAVIGPVQIKVKQVVEFAHVRTSNIFQLKLLKRCPNCENQSNCVSRKSINLSWIFRKNLTHHLSRCKVAWDEPHVSVGGMGWGLVLNILVLVL